MVLVAVAALTGAGLPWCRADSGGAGVIPAAADRAGNQARDLWRQGDVNGAEKAWRQALALAPTWVDPQAGLAVVYQSRGEDTQARECYLRVQAASAGSCPAAASEEQRALRNLIVSQEANLAFLINRERRLHKVKLLLPDAAVGRIARQHSEEMRDLKYYGHDSPVEGMGNVADRFLRAFGVRPRCIAENISRRWGLSCRLNDARITESHQGLMCSAGHRANILYPDFEVLGVGLAANLVEEYWITEVFVQPRQQLPPESQ